MKKYKIYDVVLDITSDECVVITHYQDYLYYRVCNSRNDSYDVQESNLRSLYDDKYYKPNVNDKVKLGDEWKLRDDYWTLSNCVGKYIDTYDVDQYRCVLSEKALSSIKWAKEYSLTLQFPLKGDSIININDQIEKLKADLEILEGKKKEMETNEWKMHPVLFLPSIGDTYYSYSYTCGIEEKKWFNFPENKLDYTNGNVWRTKEDASKYKILGAITYYLREIANFNKTSLQTYWKPNWSDKTQVRYFLRYNCYENRLVWDRTVAYKTMNDLFYIKSMDYCPSKKAIESFESYIQI